jgi:hypothetical protein
MTRNYFPSESFFQEIAFLSLWGVLSDERSGLSFVKYIIHIWMSSQPKTSLVIEVSTAFVVRFRGLGLASQRPLPHPASTAGTRGEEHGIKQGIDSLRMQFPQLHNHLDINLSGVLSSRNER